MGAKLNSEKLGKFRHSSRMARFQGHDVRLRLLAEKSSRDGQIHHETHDHQSTLHL